MAPTARLVDLDGCVVDGVPTSEAAGTAGHGGVYIEVSPSGKGLRAFGWRRFDAGANGQIGGLKAELYSKGRYLTAQAILCRQARFVRAGRLALKLPKPRAMARKPPAGHKPPAPTCAPPSPAKAAEGADKRVQAASVDAAIDGRNESCGQCWRRHAQRHAQQRGIGVFRLREFDPSTVWQALTNAALVSRAGSARSGFNLWLRS